MLLLSNTISFSFILLTAANYTLSDIVAFVVGICLLAVVGFWLYKKYKSMPDGDAKLQELFNSMQSIVIGNIIEALENLNIADLSKSLAEIEAQFIESIYEDIWNLFDKEIEKVADTDNVLYLALRKAITKEKVEAYVATIFATEDIQNKIIDIYNIAISKKVEEMEKEDEKLAAEMEAYENGEVEAEPVEELDPMVDSMVPREEQTIIPPSEEESETVSVDDESIEIIEEVPNVEESAKIETTVSEETYADTESFSEE